MLGISSNTPEKVSTQNFDALLMIKDSKTSKVLLKSFSIIFGVLMIFIFLPWTQNIRAKGYLISLSPDKRPQNIQSIIPGRIERWYVREGDYVNKGDTILKIGEIKNDYFDPKLLERTSEQIAAKQEAISGYSSKIASLDRQIEALKNTKTQKEKQAKNYILQARLKIKSDSTDLIAARINYDIAVRQYDRTKSLYDEGLKSLTDLETKKLKMQETNAKLIVSENKLLTSQNYLINAEAELVSVYNQYNDKLAKAESDKYSAVSNKFDAQVELSKAQNKFSNYSIRNDQYFVLAPQDGYITKVLITGLGENIKEGQPIVSIMPAHYDLAVEMYVKPMDLPLIQKGQKVRFMFDGWPSIVFSGWPNSSYGTFGGKVVAMDNFISENGQYRILVAEDESDKHPWPQGLRVGSGANGMALLKNVPIWYEIWRNLNGFPPDYYKNQESGKTKDKADKK